MNKMITRSTVIKVVVALTITVIIAYSYISFNQEFAFVAVANCTQSAAARLIVSKDNWKRWWPGSRLPGARWMRRCGP